MDLAKFTLRDSPDISHLPSIMICQISAGDANFPLPRDENA